MATAPEELPFHLRGNDAPVAEELTETSLRVEGAIPPELRGSFLRNGPNPRESTAHWFMGEGMVHGVHLEDGRASGYRNRWIKGKAFTEGANFVDEEGNVDYEAGVGNTNVVCHAGRILALVESSFPHLLTRDLETVGAYDFGGKLKSAMTAHPKLCPITGEMHFFGYGFAPPLLSYHRVDAGGALVQTELIDVPGPTMMHDFAITEKNVIFMDLPIIFSPEALMAGGMPYVWSDDYGARLGVMPRGASASQVRWYEIEPCYAFHSMNASERDGRIVLDVARYPELWRENASQFEQAFLHRFEIDPASGKVSEAALDERPMEFPRVDPRREGLPNRFGYAASSEVRDGVAATERRQRPFEVRSPVRRRRGSRLRPRPTSRRGRLRSRGPRARTRAT